MSYDMNTFLKGRQSENRAYEYFLGRGFVFVCRNFRWAGGEIDLVFLEINKVKPPTIVFIEVRSSFACSGSTYLRSSIGVQKRRRLRKTIDRFLFVYKKKLPVISGIRFDLMWIESDHLDHWPNIFI